MLFTRRVLFSCLAAAIKAPCRRNVNNGSGRFLKKFFNALVTVFNSQSSSSSDKREPLLSNASCVNFATLEFTPTSL
ncbi:hypothetical protein X975_24256, partial [Stegodyphus mimosarum]